MKDLKLDGLEDFTVDQLGFIDKYKSLDAKTIQTIKMTVSEYVEELTETAERHLLLNIDNPELIREVDQRLRAEQQELFSGLEKQTVILETQARVLREVRSRLNGVITQIVPDLVEELRK